MSILAKQDHFRSSILNNSLILDDIFIWVDTIHAVNHHFPSGFIITYVSVTAVCLPHNMIYTYIYYKPLVRQQSLIDFTWLHKFSVGMWQCDKCVGVWIFATRIISSISIINTSHGCGNFIRINQASLGEPFNTTQKWKISMMIQIWSDNAVLTSAIIVLDGWVLFILSQSFGKW